MKRFRSVTIFTLAAIAIMVTANIVYLYSLYCSIREQSIQTATECLRRADILDIIARMKGTDIGNDDSFIRLTMVVEGEKAADGTYKYPNLLENMEQTMSNYFHVIEAGSHDMPERDTNCLSQIFRQELENAGLYPKKIVVTDGSDNLPSYSSYWHIVLKDSGGTPMLNGYISPLTGYIFNKMAGIIITSAAILALMTFLIWYLLLWVGKLKSIEQMKDDFTHNMTHELKTPVAVAYSAADSMLRYYDHSDEERNRKLLSIIMQRLNYLGGMIENILSMSMERFKSMQLNIEKVSLKPLVEEIAGMMEMKADKPVNIDVQIEQHAEVYADPLHLGNVISNLIDNAVKYSGNTVDIKIIGDNHKIEISDNGIGIPKDSRPYIFDKFYRATNGDKYEVSGYGLGLYYAKQITDMHGWCIAVDSECGIGTVFTIYFDKYEKR